jgi:hypothetical protein
MWAMRSESISACQFFVSAAAVAVRLLCRRDNASSTGTLIAAHATPRRAFIAALARSRSVIPWSSPLRKASVKRPDLFELIEHAKTAGVRVSLTPSATPLLTRRAFARTRDPLAEESCCSYVPKNHIRTEDSPSQWRRPQASNDGVGEVGRLTSR